MIADNLLRVHERIASACTRAGRPVQSVTLLVVSKTFPAEAVREAVTAGERCFGENYVQEGLDKIGQLADLREGVEWHLIGPLQSNKTRVVAAAFDWVHSIDRLKTAERLSTQRPAGAGACRCLSGRAPTRPKSPLGQGAAWPIFPSG